MARHRTLTLVLAALLSTAGRPVAGEPPPDDDPEEPGAALSAFDGELKAALAAKDPGALALLVQFPLRCNHPDGSVTSIDNPRALQVHFDEVFTTRVRDAIRDTEVGDLIRRDMLGYGGGSVWVAEEGQPARYRVAVVNLPGEDPPAGRRLAFVCDTGKHRVIVEDEGGGKARYRAWNVPRSPLEKPDLEATGSGGVEGTGGCARFVWTFRPGKAEIVVGEVGCVEEEPPDGVRGELVVTTGGKTTSSWCY